MHDDICMIGLLPSVGLRASTTSSTISLTWLAPFSLAILGDRAGISYQVDVFDSVSFILRNIVNVTEFSYQIPSNRACLENGYAYTFTVSPVNVVGIGAPSTWNFSRFIGRKLVL